MLTVYENYFELRIKGDLYSGRIDYAENEGYYIYSVKKHNILSCSYEFLFNGDIFTCFGYITEKDRKQLFTKILGYYKHVPLVWFPFCKSKEDIIKILSYLNKIYPSNSHFLYLQNLV